MRSFSILITDDNTSVELPETIQSFNEHIPNNTHVIWDDKMIKSFLKECFSSEVLDAYNSLQPYAYKADFASYCILFEVGGLYSAITNELVSTPPVYLDKDLLIFKDVHSETSWAVACQLIQAKPKNPVFAFAINTILNNVKNKYYGHNPLCVTGPIVLGQAVASVGNFPSYTIGSFDGKPDRAFMLEDKTIIAKYKKLDGGVVGIAGTNNYNDFWNNKNVYGEVS